jgi:hypothetical protein
MCGLGLCVFPLSHSAASALQQSSKSSEYKHDKVGSNSDFQSKWISAPLGSSVFYSGFVELVRAQIGHEILHSRDLSKKGPPLRRLAYAMRTASKAIVLSTQ